jgi:copper-containing nitrite reductase
MSSFHRVSSRPFVCASLLLLSMLAGCGVGATGPVSAMAFAPHVPPPIRRWSSALVHVELNATIHQIGLARGVLYNAWTFNGTVPGPFIRARVGDTLEVGVTNSDPSGMPHNLDFHAVTGPGGGGAVTTVVPGQRQTGRFLMQHAGLFIYHCGSPPIMDHISNGMYGLLLVEPPGGLPSVDREYYVLKSEFYTTAPDPVTMVAAYSHAAGLREEPTYVVFNGDTTALMGERALVAETNETVRIYFGNAGPNQIASFHVVGMVMDRVYREGDLVSPPARDVQTTLVPPGGAAVVDFTATVPGIYTLLDHAIFRTEKGAAGLLKVTGMFRPDVFSGQTPYDPARVMKH